MSMKTGRSAKFFDMHKEGAAFQLDEQFRYRHSLGLQHGVPLENSSKPSSLPDSSRTGR